MKYILCSIYDSAVEAYMRPFTAQSPGQATRLFEDELRRPESDMGRHPEDYSLFQIGTFDDSSGSVEPANFSCLARAHEILALENNLDKVPMANLIPKAIEE